MDKKTIFSYARKFLSQQQEFEVKKIEVRGKENDEDNIQTLDLITNKVSIQINYNPPRSINLIFLGQILEKVIEEYLILKPEIDMTYKVKRIN